MNEAKKLERACTVALEHLDAYLDRELPLEQTREMDAHMSGCTMCMSEADLRTQLRNRLRGAVKAGVETPAFLESRIRANLQRVERRQWWRAAWVPAASLAALCLVGVIGYQVAELRETAESQESYIAKVSNRVATLMRVGLRDHIHCAVFRKYPKNAPTVESLARKMGPEYAALLPVVKDKVPKDFKLMLGHVCDFHGRDFVHMAFVKDSKVMSLVIANKQDGESFTTEGLVPALREAGLPMYQARAEKFEIAAFESSHHLVYVISDLPKEQNAEMMLALAPEVKRHLESGVGI